MTSNHITPSPLAFNGVAVRDRGEMLSLTDMWKAAGSEKSRQPSEWLDSSDGKRFCDTAEEMLNPLKNIKPENSRFEEKQLVSTKKGGNDAGTWAHWQIALAYAKYLSPEFHMQCNVIIRERMEGHRSGTVSPQALEQIERSFGIMRMLAHKVTETEKVVNTIPALIETVNALAAIVQPSTPGVIIRHGKTAGDILKAMGFTNCPKGLAQRVGNWLKRAGCLAEGRIDTGTVRFRLFDPDRAEAWFRAGGAAAVEREIAEKRGQGALALTGQIVRKLPDDVPDGVGAIRIDGEIVYFNATDSNLGPGDTAVVVTHAGKLMIDTPTPGRPEHREWMSSRRLEKMPGFAKPVMTQWECTYIGKVIGRGNVVSLRPASIPAH